MIFGKNRSSGGVEWLLVCLGNPGDPYENTRHNVGFQVADEIAARKDVPVQRLKFRASPTRWSGRAKVLLMKPVTYMNLSGEAARRPPPFYKVPPSGCWWYPTTWPCRRQLRIRKGAARGHNG
jgi:PTH1 family peptidyl-tRNA hydrolase